MLIDKISNFGNALRRDIAQEGSHCGEKCFTHTQIPTNFVFAKDRVKAHLLLYSDDVREELILKLALANQNFINEL